MTTVLALGQAFAYEINEPPPTVLATSSNPSDLQILYLIYAVARDLRQARFWPQQKRAYTITSTSGTRTQYPLPKDFYAGILDTQYDDTTKRALNGPISDGYYAYRNYGTGSNTFPPTYRIFGPDFNPNTTGGQFNISPAIPTNEVISFDYISRNVFMPQNWAPSTAFSITKYANHVGNNYVTTTGGTSAAGSTNGPTGTGTGITDGTCVWSYYDTPYEAIIADTDICLFDDDLMILGLKARWLQAKGEDNASIYADYTSKIDQAANRFNGSWRGSLSRYPRGYRRYGPTTVGGWSY